ncbi:hypothetical protein X777_16093, partial [Ooceraea biroi]
RISRKFSQFSKSKNEIDRVVSGSDDLRNCQLGNRTVRTMETDIKQQRQRERERKRESKLKRDKGDIEKQRRRIETEKRRGTKRGSRIESDVQKPRRHRRGLIDLTYLSEGYPHDGGAVIQERRSSATTSTTTPWSLTN